MKWLDTYLFFSPRVAKYEVLSPYEAESELSATWEIGLGTCGERSSVGTERGGGRVLSHATHLQ